jgi:protein gp37
MSSAIEWTDEVWNPTVGCSKVSPGCDNCYAIRVAAREMQEAHKGLTEGGRNALVKWFDAETGGYTRPGRVDLGPLDWTGEVRLLPDRLDTPLHWRKPRRVFVDSMSDLFHPDVPEKFIASVWNTMARTPRHTYQILTKRPQRMASVLPWIATPDGDPALLPNVWLGTSASPRASPGSSSNGASGCHSGKRPTTS